MSDLRRKIMYLRAGLNMLVDPSGMGGTATEREKMAYRRGHRDARHAAAELATAHDAKRAMGLSGYRVNSDSSAWDGEHEQISTRDGGALGVPRDETFRSGAAPNYGHHMTVPHERPKAPAEWPGDGPMRRDGYCEGGKR